MNLYQRVEELERQAAQNVVRGKVEKVDYENHLARVRYGDDQLTPWLRWKPQAAGKAVMWYPLTIGEAVTVISPGDLQLGEIFPSSYCQAHSAPSTNPDLCIVQFADGSVVEHNTKTGDYTLTIKGNVTINCDGAVNINSQADDIQLNGGKGVVTGAHKCAYTGLPHSDCSTQVKAGK